MWGIGLWGRYRSDLVFHSVIRLSVLYVAFFVLLCVLCWYTLLRVQNDTQAYVLEQAALQADAGAAVAYSLSGFQLLSGETQVLVGVVVALLLLFGIVLTYVTMQPIAQALRSQKRFIADMGHEVRNPLATLKVAVEVGMMQHASNSEVYGMLKEQDGHVDRISDVVNNLLTFTSLSKYRQVEHQDVSVQELVAASQHMHAALAKERGVVLDSGAVGSVCVHGSKNALQTMLNNVLHNALSYSPQGGTVTCSVTKVPGFGGLVDIVVSDQGEGIAAQDLPHVTDPFYRVSKDRCREAGHVGLGLSVAHEIVRMHGGTLHISSKKGAGTTVTMRVPCGVER